MRRYCITDSIEVVRRALDLDAEMIQIRAKELSGRALYRLVEQAVAVAGRRIVVNSRADVAVACGAGGVHLRSDSPVAAFRLRFGTPFLVGCSCHTVEDLHDASLAGADFAVYGPVFFSPGKGAPVGLVALRAAVRAVQMPVYALGGVTRENEQLCVDAGAYGVAGIRFFVSSTGETTFSE